MNKFRDVAPYLFLASRALCSPLEALFTLLIFILSKESGATAVQLTVLACTKPIVSLLAFHTSASIVGKPQRIKYFLIGATLVGALPCLFFPFVKNTWYYVISYALFMTTLRASAPAWIEILRSHLGRENMRSVVAKGSSINYFIIILIPLLLANLMDKHTEIWKTMVFFLALLHLMNIPLLFNLNLNPVSFSNTTLSILATPWKEGFKLLKANPYFAHYQILFFLGGAGLVAMQPILPIYFKDTLHISYTQLALAFSLCRGVAFIFSSPFWVHLSQSKSLYFLNAAVNFLSCLFIVCILSSSGEINWLFVAYIMYGVMQAGCELSWNLSGPTFSKNKESILFSNVNLACVGLRGCFFPFIGQLIFWYANTLGVFIFAGSLCFVSLLYAIWLDFSCRTHFKLTRETV